MLGTIKMGSNLTGPVTGKSNCNRDSQKQIVKPGNRRGLTRGQRVGRGSRFCRRCGMDQGFGARSRGLGRGIKAATNEQLTDDQNITLQLPVNWVKNMKNQIDRNFTNHKI